MGADQYGVVASVTPNGTSPWSIELLSRRAATRSAHDPQGVSCAGLLFFIRFGFDSKEGVAMISRHKLVIRISASCGF